MKTLSVIYLLLFSVIINFHSAEAEPILVEKFETGSLDPRITIQTTGTFNSDPGIVLFPGLGSGHAFAFGRSTNHYDSYDNYVTDLIIRFASPTAVRSIKFKEMERYGNWGSNGQVLADGNFVSSWFGFGRMPYNDQQPDSTFRTHEFMINGTINEIRIRVQDITDVSEILIDDLEIE